MALSVQSLVGNYILVEEGRLGQPGAILGLLKLLLGLPELGQVEGGDLLGLLNLLLVGLDLGLQLASEVAHGHLVLLVLVVLEGELLDLALSLLVTLHVVGRAGLHASKLNLKLSDAGLQLGHGGLQRPLALGLDRDVVLLSAELISETSSVNHCLLGLLLGALGLVEHVVDLSLQGVDGALEAALVSSSARVDIVHLVDGHAGFGQLGLSLSLAPF